MGTAQGEIFLRFLARGLPAIKDPLTCSSLSILSLAEALQYSTGSLFCGVPKIPPPSISPVPCRKPRPGYRTGALNLRGTHGCGGFHGPVIAIDPIAQATAVKHQYEMVQMSSQTRVKVLAWSLPSLRGALA